MDDRDVATRVDMARSRMRELQTFVASLDKQVGQLNELSLSDELFEAFRETYEALKKALLVVSVDKARQDIAQAQKVMQTATAFIRDHLEPDSL